MHELESKYRLVNIYSDFHRQIEDTLDTKHVESVLIETSSPLI